MSKYISVFYHFSALRLHKLLKSFLFERQRPVYPALLTHWGRVMHICVGKLIIIAPGRCQAIILTNDGILLIGLVGTNFNEILIEIHTFSFKKMHLKMSSAKWRPFCLGPNVSIVWLITWFTTRNQDTRSCNSSIFVLFCFVLLFRMNSAKGDNQFYVFRNKFNVVLKQFHMHYFIFICE